jgi:hypothetical protein
VARGDPRRRAGLALLPAGLRRGRRLAGAEWYESADATVFGVLRKESYPEYEDWLAMTKELLAREIGEGWDERDTAEAFYERHNERVRREAPADRLLDWRAADGWEPLCAALGVPVPDEPFPHTNTRAEWSS